MRNNEFSRKEIVESPVDKKSSSKPQESSSYLDRARKGIGVASAGALKALTVGLALQSGFGAVPGVEGIRAPGTGLQVHGDYNRSKVSEQLVKQDHLTQHEKQEQIFSAVLDRASTDPRFARKVLETMKDHRKLAVGPDVTCLQWGFPNSVTGIAVGVAGGGTALSVDYNLNALNNCPTPISSVEFVSTEVYSCPAGCTQDLVTKPADFFGVPSSITQGAMSAGKLHENIACWRVDANGAQTPTVPNGMSASVYLLGQQDGTLTQTLPQPFNIYP